MQSCSYTYDKSLWLKIILAAVVMIYSALKALEAALSHISIASLPLEEYNNDFESLLYGVVAALFGNYLIVCIFRLRDRIVVSDGLVDICVHKNTLFLCSGKHIKVAVSEILECSVYEYPFFIRLKLKLPHGKWHTYPVSSIGVEGEALADMLSDLGVKLTYPKEKSELRKWMEVIVLATPLIIMVLAASMCHDHYCSNMFMPTMLCLPLSIIGVLLGFSLRDTLGLDWWQCHLIGPTLGLGLYVSALVFNYRTADLSKADIKEYDIARCYSVHHSAKGHGRYRTSAHTTYHLKLTEKDSSRLIKIYRISQETYEKAKHADCVRLPVCRGALGYSVTNEDDMEFVMDY